MKFVATVMMAALIAAGSVYAEGITVIRNDDGSYTAETDALGVDVTNKPEGIKAIYDAVNGAGEGMQIDETQHGFGLAGGKDGVKPSTETSKPVDEPKVLTDKQKAELENMKSMCQSADGKKLAADMVANEDSMKADMMDAKMKVDAPCLGASKAMYAACAKGDNAGVAAGALKAAQVCQREDLNKYKEESPTGTDGIVTGAVDKIDPLEKIKETVEKAFTGTPLAGSTNMQSNPLQQILMSMITEKVMSSLNGGSGSGSGGTGSGSYTVCVASVTAALQNPNGMYFGGTYCPAGTLPKTVTNPTVTPEKEPEVVKPPTCDSVKTSTTASTTSTEMGADLKDVKVVTRVVTDTCANGNTRVKTVVTKTGSDGKDVVTEKTTITAK